jgi:anti-sigma28 factor (negative regulator of flagellin synthesis)
MEPIDPASFASIKKAVDNGSYQVANEPITG